ncbi:type IV pilus modification PilV family protein [Helicobacter turcicus]|uniref:type IV pilus modification PilV family protein n=1 Tax=Helicobacter turcicus TaxID=2867412 RepID=UPI001C8828AB|nr:hypothetical protein [Helicobacter turcicus]MBX7546007.1 hypothetical protein [Helicobacter turcicus]
MKAFALLEFLVFMVVLGVAILGVLGNLKQNHSKNPQNTHNYSYESVTFCNKISPNCILDSNIPPLTPLFEINATKAY